jgi:hypothetical protein
VPGATVAPVSGGYVPDPRSVGELVEQLTEGRRIRPPPPVTHWHLCQAESATLDLDRFTAERFHRLRHSGLAGTTDDPAEAVRWVFARRAEALRLATDPVAAAHRRWRTPADWAESIRTTWWIALHCPATPLGGPLTVHEGWTVEIYAYPMSPSDCSRVHR